METLSLIGNAFAGMMNPMSILLLIVGVAVGIVFGSIPGLSAAMAVRAGMDEEDALAAITINAAKIAGIDDRVGSLAPGKDADLVLTTGHPINLLSRVKAVFINGCRVNG